MSKKQLIRTAILRPELLTQSAFGRRYKVCRVKLRYLIAENLLNTEQICNVHYIDVSDKAAIDNALGYKTRNPMDWHVATPVHRKKQLKDTFDSRMDAAFEAFERGETE